MVGAGAQIMNASSQPEADQSPGSPTPVASFNVTQLGDTPDKIGKDDNFRGLAELQQRSVLHQGQRQQRRQHGVLPGHDRQRLPGRRRPPGRGAPLPTAALAYDPRPLRTGLAPEHVRARVSRRRSLRPRRSFPFGLWFANTDTLYVADEGNGENTYGGHNEYTKAAAEPRRACRNGSLTSAPTWQLAYTFQTGLNLGQPYTVPGYPTGDNASRACRGPRPTMVCATSPAGSTRTGQRRSAASPRRSAAAATRAPIRTSSSRSPTRSVR